MNKTSKRFHSEIWSAVTPVKVAHAKRSRALGLFTGSVTAVLLTLPGCYWTTSFYLNISSAHTANDFNCTLGLYFPMLFVSCMLSIY